MVQPVILIGKYPVNYFKYFTCNKAHYIIKSLMFSSPRCCPLIYEHKECIHKISVPSLCQNCNSIYIFAHKLCTHSLKLSPLDECSHCMHLVGQIQGDVPPLSKLLLEMLLADVLIIKSHCCTECECFLSYNNRSSGLRMESVETDTHYYKLFKIHCKFIMQCLNYCH
jgi:hypothetical protein